MATQTGTIKFTGKLGDIVGYRRKQKHCLRTRPEKVHQTAATKRAASAFGAISKKGRLIRRSLLNQLDVRYDGTLVNRVNRALVLGEQQLCIHGVLSAPAIHTHYALPPDVLPAHPRTCALQHLEGFSFNPYTSLRQLLSKAPVLTQNGVLQLAPQLLRGFGKATHLEIRAVGVRINFSERRVVNTDENGIIIELGNETCNSFDGLELPLSVPGKGTLFVVLQLRSGSMHKDVFLPSGDRRYSAADIIAVIPPVRQHQLSTQKNAWKQPVQRSSFNQAGDQLCFDKLNSHVRDYAVYPVVPIASVHDQAPLPYPLE